MKNTGKQALRGTQVTPSRAPRQTGGALLRLDEPAPYFEGRSTHGFTRLTDYAGKWLVFFSHPADFTPVCASEMAAFARNRGIFDTMGCALLGLSVDNVYAHLAWRESIQQQFGVTVDFPILADAAAEIARRYGLRLDSASESDPIRVVRAVFVIDPAGVLRAMLWYPISTGRSVAEVIRLVRALQTADRLHVATPEGWQPGQEPVQPPPQTVETTEGRRESAYGCVDWYSYKQPVPGQ